MLLTPNPPPPPPFTSKEQTGFGKLTCAWFAMGDEIADYEAGLAAERRRIIVVGTILGLVAAAIVGLALIL